MADLDAGATGTMPSALLPDLIRLVLEHHRAGRRTEAADVYARILPLINYENRQCGLRAIKTVMAAGGVIRSDFVRHPLEPLHPKTREGLLEIAREIQPSLCDGANRRSSRNEWGTCFKAVDLAQILRVHASRKGGRSESCVTGNRWSSMCAPTLWESRMR